MTYLAIMAHVANREVFPNLAQQRDAEHLLEQARSAVAELRRYTIDHVAQQRAEDKFERELAEFQTKTATSRPSPARWKPLRLTS